MRRSLLVGQDGWAGGLQMLSRTQGGGAAKWEPGSGIARYFVTHDGGHGWTVAPSAGANLGGSVASLVGGEAWAVGVGSNVAILHSPAVGDRLIATATQPILGGLTNIGVQGAGAVTAYVVNANAPTQAFATHDDGGTWQRLTPPPCTGSTRTWDSTQPSGGPFGSPARAATIRRPGSSAPLTAGGAGGNCRSTGVARARHSWRR